MLFKKIFTLALFLLAIVSYANIAPKDTSNVAAKSALPNTTIDSVEKFPKAAWIILEGDVDEGMADYAQRAINDAKLAEPDIIVFEINTFGGLLHAAFDIVDTITALRDIPTVAFISQKAISAGALIALSCDRLYMKPSTTIGDCAPILQGEGGPQILGEKIQSPLRAKFRNLAQRNGHPELLSEAMVTPELEIISVQKGDSFQYMEAKDFEELSDEQKKSWESKRTIVREGELLTMTEVEAIDLGFSLGTIETKEELMKALGIEEIVTVEISWSEELARFLAAISPLLMMLAFGALYMEFQTPGFGFFGIAGIILIAIVVAGQYVSGLSNHLPIILFVVGILLALVEILIFPGTWIAAIGSILSLGAALVVAIGQNGTGISAPEFTGINFSDVSWALTQVIGSALMGLILPILATRYLFPRLSPANSPILQSAITGHAPQEATQSLEVGQQGQSTTLLKPAGKARFNGSIYDVESISGFLEAQTPVVISRISGKRIEVKSSEVKA